MKFEEYFKMYLFSGNEKNEKERFSKIRFWASTLLMVSTKVKIQMKNGRFLTEKDCFIEMEDALRGYEFEDGDTRAWWEQFQYLRKQIEKPYWVN